jgi:short-subunit dehydrogenase involved in D-alanine esterification of teichoic acids
LTQLTRSPLVRKSTQAGVYQLDRSAPEQLRRRLEDLQREMRELTAPTFVTGATDLAAVRAQRVALGKDISRVEKALEEALQLLGETDVTVVRAAAG